MKRNVEAGMPTKTGTANAARAVARFVSSVNTAWRKTAVRVTVCRQAKAIAGFVKVVAELVSRRDGLGLGPRRGVRALGDCERGGEAVDRGKERGGGAGFECEKRRAIGAMRREPRRRTEGRICAEVQVGSLTGMEEMEERVRVRERVAKMRGVKSQ